MVLPCYSCSEWCACFFLYLSTFSPLVLSSFLLWFWFLLVYFLSRYLAIVDTTQRGTFHRTLPNTEIFSGNSWILCWECLHLTPKHPCVVQAWICVQFFFLFFYVWSLLHISCSLYVMLACTWEIMYIYKVIVLSNWLGLTGLGFILSCWPQGKQNKTPSDLKKSNSSSTFLKYIFPAMLKK